jgi:hypothetical protein
MNIDQRIYKAHAITTMNYNTSGVECICRTSIAATDLQMSRKNRVSTPQRSCTECTSHWSLLDDLEVDARLVRLLCGNAIPPPLQNLSRC